MRASIGNSLLLNIVIIIVSLVILVFVGILSYSKAYRVKNGIIEILERNEELNDTSTQEISQYLKQTGYKVGKCPKDKENNGTGYKVCIEQQDSDINGYRFKVTVYVEYNFPIVNSILSTPVTGETRTLGVNYSEYN